MYKFDYIDFTDIECVLTDVRMERVARETYRLPASEKLRVEKLLNRTLQFESGDLMEEDLLENEKVQDGE